MNIIFLGNIVSPKDIDKYSAGSVAGNKMQFYLLKYLSKIEGVQIDIISSYSYAAFPKDKRLIVKGVKETIFHNSQIHQLSYVNLPIVKQIMLMIKNYQTVKRISQKYENTIVFSYDLYPIQGNALRKSLRFANNIAVCLLADLSIGGVQKHKGIKKHLQKIYDRFTLRNLRVCSNYVVLNEAIIKQYVPNANYIVVQGGVEPSEYKLESLQWDGVEKNILYTGALEEYSGIMTLIDAMQYLEDKGVVLDIYGRGSLEDEIIKKSKIIKNVRYHGSVSNTEILRKQRTAWLLINPRPVNNRIAKVTFPSKIFEYMMSGRPVLSTRLSGFTEEYNDKIFWIEDDGVQGICRAIQVVLNLPANVLKERADNAYNFLIENKTWEKNAKTIYAFLKHIQDKYKYTEGRYEY